MHAVKVRDQILGRGMATVCVLACRVGMQRATASVGLSAIQGPGFEIMPRVCIVGVTGKARSMFRRIVTCWVRKLDMCVVTSKARPVRSLQTRVRIHGIRTPSVVAVSASIIAYLVVPVEEPG